MEKNSKLLKNVGAFQRPPSPSTANVLLACKVNTEQKSLFKTKVESVVRKLINPTQPSPFVDKSQADKFAEMNKEEYLSNFDQKRLKETMRTPQIEDLLLKIKKIKPTSS